MIDDACFAVLRQKQQVLLDARHAIRDGCLPYDEFLLGQKRLKALALKPLDFELALLDLCVETLVHMEMKN